MGNKIKKIVLKYPIIEVLIVAFWFYSYPPCMPNIIDRILIFVFSKLYFLIEHIFTINSLELSLRISILCAFLNLLTKVILLILLLKYFRKLKKKFLSKVAE